MKIPRRVANGQLGMNMTPMIDVVFLLIIFFLVSSHLARRENEMRLALPSATSGEEDEPNDSPRITLNLLPDGSMFLAGGAIRREQLASRLKSAKSRHRDPLEFRIRADRDVAYQHVAPILSTAAEAGIWNVTFAVVKPEVAR